MIMPPEKEVFILRIYKNTVVKRLRIEIIKKWYYNEKSYCGKVLNCRKKDFPNR